MRNIQPFINICLMLVGIFAFSSCSTKNNDGEIHEIDKKYFSESQLFALNLAIENDPDDPENYFKRAKIYFERIEQIKAKEDIEKAIKLKNTEGKYYLLYANILLDSKKLDKALEAAKISESLKVNDAEIKILLARLYMEMGQKETAQEYLSQASLLTPYHPDILFLEGKLAALKGDTALAVIHFFESIRKDTLNTEAYKELSSIYYKKQKYDSSMLFLTVGRAIEPEDPFFYYIEGKIMEHFNLKEAAKASYLNSIKFDSTFADAYRVLGMMYYRNNNTELASGYLENELRFQPYSLKSNLVLAEIYEKQSKGNLAIPLFERVLTMDSLNKVAKSSLEKLYVLFPKNEPKPKVDSISLPTAIKEPAKAAVSKSIIIDSATIKKTVKPGTGQPAKIDTASKKTVSPKTELKNTKKASDSTKEIKTFKPIFKNPDSSKIEIRKDTVK